MIVYHGTPFGGDRGGVTRFLQGRHALIPFPRPEDAAVAFHVCQTVCIDNGAFSAWKVGRPVTDWTFYYQFCKSWCRHPAFAWAIIPDVIDGSEEDNDALLSEWDPSVEGVPVWHLHESLERLERLCEYKRICLGSSGQFSQLGTKAWWARILEAMRIICDEKGNPRTRIHGLRMAAREYTSRIPFASVDSTNVARNASSCDRFGTYVAPHRWQRAEAIASRMEGFETASFFDWGQWRTTEGKQIPLTGDSRS